MITESDVIHLIYTVEDAHQQAIALQRPIIITGSFSVSVMFESYLLNEYLLYKCKYTCFVIIKDVRISIVRFVQDRNICTFFMFKSKQNFSNFKNILNILYFTKYACDNLDKFNNCDCLKKHDILRHFAISFEI
ncbi:hypothetical protein [Amedibacillus sp. YH-ame10]